MYTIDRFEGNWAVIECEDRSMFKLPLNILPQGISEGDIIQITVTIDSLETEKKKSNAEVQIKDFFTK